LLGLREFETREKEEKVAISLVWNIQETWKRDRILVGPTTFYLRNTIKSWQFLDIFLSYSHYIFTLFLLLSFYCFCYKRKWKLFQKVVNFKCSNNIFLFISSHKSEESHKGMLLFICTPFVYSRQTQVIV
jgi:hypothetical protein